MTPIQRDLLRVAGEAAVRLSERLYRLGWATHHKAAQIEDWGTQAIARAQPIQIRNSGCRVESEHPDQEDHR